jgi:hypothetical protein
MLYKLFQFALESNIPLPELPQAEGEELEFAFRLLPMREADLESISWFHHWSLPNDDVWLSFARQESGYLLHFPNLADFVVSADAKDISCHPRLDIPLETVRHLLLDQVIPLALSKRGKLVLHSSAVVAPGGAIAFIGMTGMGKSTLTASFVKRGFPLLTDDCLLLEEKERQLHVVPSYAGLRLWDESVSVLFPDGPMGSQVAHYTNKKRLDLSGGQLRFSSNPVLLQRMYFLDSPQEEGDTKTISITPLTAREALLELISYSFKLDITDREFLKQEFEYLCDLATLPLFYRLIFPRDLSLLPIVEETILENLNTE